MRAEARQSPGTIHLKRRLRRWLHQLGLKMLDFRWNLMICIPGNSKTMQALPQVHSTWFSDLTRRLWICVDGFHDFGPKVENEIPMCCPRNTQMKINQLVDICLSCIFVHLTRKGLLVYSQKWEDGKSTGPLYNRWWRQCFPVDVPTNQRSDISWYIQKNHATNGICWDIVLRQVHTMG